MPEHSTLYSTLAWSNILYTGILDLTMVEYTIYWYIRPCHGRIYRYKVYSTLPWLDIPYCGIFDLAMVEYTILRYIRLAMVRSIPTDKQYGIQYGMVYGIYGDTYGQTVWYIRPWKGPIYLNMVYSTLFRIIYELIILCLYAKETYFRVAAIDESCNCDLDCD